MQKLCQCWPCTQWLMKPPREWRKWWLRPWGALTILPPPPTAGLSEVRLSLVFLPIGLTLTVSKDAQQPIACKQLRGLHTFDVLASTLNDIHSEFEIWGKILRTTIDNGPNFIKALMVMHLNQERMKRIKRGVKKWRLLMCQCFWMKMMVSSSSSQNTSTVLVTYST